MAVSLVISQSLSNGIRVDQPLRQQSKSRGTCSAVIGLLNLLFLHRDNLELSPISVYGQSRLNVNTNKLNRKKSERSIAEALDLF